MTSLINYLTLLSKFQCYGFLFKQNYWTPYIFVRALIFFDSAYLFNNVINGECVEVGGDEVQDQPVSKLLEGIQRIWFQDSFNLTSFGGMAALKKDFESKYSLKRCLMNPDI